MPASKKKVRNIFTQYAGLRRENYVLFFGRLVTNLGSMIWPVLTLILNQKMDLSASSTALCAIGAGLLLLPAGLIGGKLADKYNKKHIIVYCDVISVILYAVCGFIPLSYVTIALVVVAAACQYLEQPVYNALIADISKSEDRERAYSLQYLGGNIGLVASPTIAGFLFADHLSLSFLISGVAIGVSTLLIGLMVKDITPVEETHEEAPYQKTREHLGIVSLLKESWIVALFILIMGMFQGTYIQYNYLMPLDLARIHGEDGAIIFGSVSSLNCITVCLATPFITKYLERFAPAVKSLMGICLQMAGYFVFLLLMGFVPAYYIAIILFTLGEVCVTISLGPYLALRTPESHRGRINGLVSLTQGFFQGVCVVSSGFIYDAFGYMAAWMFILLLIAVTIVLSALLIEADKKKYPKLNEKHEKRFGH